MRAELSRDSRPGVGTRREYVLVAMLLPRFTVAILASAMLTACAHGVTTELPTSPGPAPITIKALTIVPQGGGILIAEDSVPITTSGTEFGLGAWALYTDNSAKFVDAQWTSSDVQVIKVENGAFVAVGRGTAVLTAKADGLAASETFTVEPNVAGTWSGRMVVDQCAAGSGSMQELICSALPGRQPGLFPAGGSAPITLAIQRNGTDLTATAQLGELRGSLHGIDRGANFLALTGDLIGGRTKVTMTYWDSRVKTDEMEAAVSFEVRIAGVPNNAAVNGHFENVTRR
jgi:hypothetical protein